MSKVVFLFERPIDCYDKKKYGFDFLKKQKFKIEAWNVEFLLYKKSSKEQKILNTKIKTIQNYDQFSLEIQKLNYNDVIICATAVAEGMSWNYRKIRKILFKTKSIISTICNNHYPGERRLNLFDHINDFFINKNLKKFLKIYIASFFGLLGDTITKFYNYKIDIIFAGVSIKGIDKNLIDHNTKIFYIHNLDVDLMINVKFDKVLNKSRPICYLDSMGPLHPDVLRYKLDYNLNAEQYFTKNKNCIKYLENVLSTKCIIAAHPKAEKGILEKYYNNLEIKYKQSASIVKHSQIVIAEASLSISLGVWFKKPIILLQHKKAPNWINDILINFKNEIGCELWDIDDKSTWKMPKVDNSKYFNFCKKYLKKEGTTSLKFWEFVSLELKKN